MRNKIFIIDNDDNARDILYRLLKGSKEFNEFTFSIYSDAKFFLEDADLQEAKLVISSIEMSPMSGEDLLYSLTDKDETQHIPVILMAGSVNNAQLERCRKKASGFFKKPFEIENIKKIILPLLLKK
jgi:FixJ family two-component response regulator